MLMKLHWKTRSRIVAGLLSAIVVLLALSSLVAPSYTHCHDAEQAKNAANEKAQPNPIPKRSDIGIFFACQGEFIDHNDKVITAIFTVVLALSTIFLWLATSNIVSSTEEANREQLKRAREIERAYFAGGGECCRDNSGLPSLQNGHRLFQFEVGNHGKTPAFMYEYALQFATLDEVCRTHIPFEPHTFVDQFPPGETNSRCGGWHRSVHRALDRRLTGHP